MPTKIAWRRKTCNQKSNADEANDENIDALLAEAAFCMNNADAILENVDMQLAA